MRGDVPLVREGRLDVIRIDIITASRADSLQLDSRMFVRPNAIITVLGALLDAR